MEIALVNICFPKEINVIAPPQGLLSLGTFLKKHGYHVTIYDFPRILPIPDFVLGSITELLLKIPEKIIGISVWDSILPKVILATKEIKKKFPDKIIILGGPTVSSLNELLLKEYSWIDYCIVGEGELPLLELLESLKLSNRNIQKSVTSQVYFSNGNEVLNGCNAKSNININTLPNIDYSLINTERYNRWEVSTSRGCPYNCEFCSVNIAVNGKLRIRELQNVFKEIDTVFLSSKSSYINIVDDNFGLNKSRFENFCETFKTEFSKNKFWSCYFRMDDFDEETIDLMSNSRCTGVFIGIENGNRKKLKQLRKYNDLEDILKRLYYASKEIDIVVSFIWGFPDESENELLKTFGLINEISSIENIVIDLYQLAPLSGTKIKKIMLNDLVFDIDAVSGFVYPPYMPKLSNSEINLIKSNKEIYSAFFHDGSTLFGNKYHMVKKYLKN